MRLRTYSRKRYTTRTVYVAKSDSSIWSDAVAFCKHHDIALSTFVADALRWYLERLITSEVHQ